jgi:hypothetical protein
MGCFGNWVGDCFSFWFLLLLTDVSHHPIRLQHLDLTQAIDLAAISVFIKPPQAFCELVDVNRTPSYFRYFMRSL